MMKTKASMFALAMIAVPVWSQVSAQEARTGVSRPDGDAIVADQEKPVAAKPSAAIPEVSATPPAPAQSEVYGAYVPYGSTATPAAAVASTGADADAQIVTAVEDRPGELREGTLLRVRLQERLSTETAEPGSSFTAELNEAVMKDGRVILPVGSVVHGRVTAVHSGRRISGSAMLHLEAKSVDLPDGTRYPIHALVIDTDQTQSLKVDHEGSLVRRDHPKETLAAVGLATGGAATAGALLGGGVGAAVGAGIGAGAGTVVWLKTDRQASIPSHALLVFSLESPMPVTPQSASVHAGVGEGSPDGQVVGDVASNLH